MSRVCTALLWIGVAASLHCSNPAWGKARLERDYVSIIGPRTVYPFVSAVSDRFGRRTRFKFPRIDITDTRTAFKLLCGGEGSEFPDLALANREMTSAEQKGCARNGVTELAGVQLGYDAVAVASFDKDLTSLTPRLLFLALAATVPDQPSVKAEAAATEEAGTTQISPQAPPSPPPTEMAPTLVDNRYRTWRELDPALPDQPISVILPPQASVAYDVFLDIILAGCRSLPRFAALEERDEASFRRQCSELRQGDLIEHYDADLEEILDKEPSPPGRLIVISLAALSRHGELLHPVTLEGQEPSTETINAGTYPGARPLHLFIRNGQFEIVPGLREFVTELTGQDATGRFGYLRPLGFVPLDEEQRSQVSTVLNDIVTAGMQTPAEQQESGQATVSPRSRLRQIDTELWNKIRRSEDPDLLKLYVDLLPDGFFAERAKDLEQRLRRRNSDSDPVPDYLDRCPGTPPEATVDERGCPLDSDGDGVPDYLDQCPDSDPNAPVTAQGCLPDRDGDGIADNDDLCGRTEPGFPVDAQGCALDGDGDGVVDPRDACPDTAVDIPVGADGCPLDRDGDGIPDSLDMCGRTEPGFPVDAQGCALDGDGDGVADPLDACPETPAATSVDHRGCLPDDDRDGVADRQDHCPGTPADANVDERGCWVLAGLSFPGGSANLATVDMTPLRQVLAVLQRNPGVRVEIQGHSDDRGRRDANITLSRARAQAVADYLVSAGIAAARLRVRGYGPDLPIASNASEAGRRRNRRVEIKPLPQLD